MCVSVTPRTKVRMKETILYAAEVCPRDGDVVHVLGYQNTVQNGAGWLSWLPFGSSGNAMLLPFPAVPGSMTKDHVLSTEDCPKILQDMADAVAPVFQASSDPMCRSVSVLPPKVYIFDSGIYTIVLAEDARVIPVVLDRVPAAKRPVLNPALFNAYAKWYPRWTMALCCFNNRRAKRATPLLWWYRPMFPDKLFLPALDCHTGDVPDLQTQVKVDHVVAVGSHALDGGTPVRYRDRVPEVIAPYLSQRLLGERCNESMWNGDFWCRTESVRAGKFQTYRLPPPMTERGPVLNAG